MPAPSSDRAEQPLDFAAILTTDSVLKDVGKMTLRYNDAILAYATALLGDADEARDVHLRVVQKMLAGDFDGATVKGRFRFYVKRAVRHAVLDHVKKRSREGSRLRRLWNSLMPDRYRWGKPMVRPALAPEADVEQQERVIWRSTVLRRTLEALEKHERTHQDRTQPNVYHTVSRLLAEHPDDTSDALAERLGEVVGGTFNASQVRGIVMRMRRKFAELLFTEVAQHIDAPTTEEVLDELCQLSLFAYAQPYLATGNAAVGEA